MAEIEILARNWKVEINASGYVEIKGLQTITLSAGSTRADRTVKESLGMEAHYVARRSKQIVLKGKFQEDPDTGSRDAGQAAVEALAELVGVSSLATFRITSPGGNTEEFSASVDMGDLLGNVDETADWAATITRSGASSLS